MKEAEMLRYGSEGIGYWVSRRAEQTPQRLAVMDEDYALTWQDFNQRVNALAAGLQSYGVSFGDRVAGVLLNSVPFLEAVFACAKLGAVFVPINFRLAPQEVEYIVRDSGSLCVMYHESFSPLVTAACRNTAVTHYIPAADPGFQQNNPYDSWLSLHMGAGEPHASVRGEDIHMMMYTSGTTGRPKGAMLSHRNATWNAIQLMLHEAALRPGDIVLTVAPLFHIGGLGIHTLPALYQGIPVLLFTRFHPEEVLQTIQARRITALFLVPAMWEALSRVPAFDSYDLSSLRLLLCGGAPCPVPVIEFFQSRGLNFLEGFGMTETSPIAMLLNAEDAIAKHGSIGRPVFHLAARIADERGEAAAVGTIGELALIGPNVFEGYWNNQPATQEAFRGGWFHTGDLARQDDQGFFYLVDRKKDMLISGGENVYSVEVEQVLVRHPAIREVAVIGVPDSRWGEVPLAVVVLADPHASLTLAEVSEFCAKHLAKFKIPKHLQVVQELPRNATGKILKTTLRSSYQRMREDRQ